MWIQEEHNFNEICVDLLFEYTRSLSTQRNISFIVDRECFGINLLRKFFLENDDVGI